MARQDMWVHGNAVMLRYPGGKGDPVGSPHTANHQMNGVFDPATGGLVEWSDIVGFRQDFGVTFRGRANQRNNFMAVIPSPCIRDGKRALVDQVGFSFESDEAVLIDAVHVFDNRERVADLPVHNLSGPHHDLVSNLNLFNINPTPITAVGITFDVFFSQEGNITFFCLGAVFEV